MKTDVTRAPDGSDAPSRASKETPPRTASPGFSQVLAGTSATGATPAGQAAAPPTGTGADGTNPAGAPLGPLPPTVSTEALLAAQTVGASRGLSFEPFRGALRGSRGDPLDPATRQSAQLAPPMLASPTPASSPGSGPDAAPQVCARASLEEVLPALVRRIAWSGDGQKGSVRLEFGAGALAGGTLVVHSDGGRVRVELDAPAGADAAAWKERITSRLAERQLQVEDVDVR